MRWTVRKSAVESWNKNPTLKCVKNERLYENDNEKKEIIVKHNLLSNTLDEECEIDRFCFKFILMRKSENAANYFLRERSGGKTQKFKKKIICYDKYLRF